MFRGIILIGFTYLIMHLHTSGSISKYINMKYSYLSFSAMIALALLSIVQIIIVAKEKPAETKCGPTCCDHDHGIEDKWYKKLLIYPIFLFPVVTGLFLPIATLDSNIVKAKGFHFPVYDEGEGDPYSQQQFLRPDTSVYFGKEAYDELMSQEKDRYIDKNKIILGDANYLNGMETIYNFPGEFLGKEIKFKGFVFNDEETGIGNQVFIFRFGIIHCIADSGVFGMLAELPEGTKLENDQWITISGEISSVYYQPFKANIPIVKVKEWDQVPAPSDEYVYRKN
jgi:putative membrane protein